MWNIKWHQIGWMPHQTLLLWIQFWKRWKTIYLLFETCGKYGYSWCYSKNIKVTYIFHKNLLCANCRIIFNFWRHPLSTPRGSNCDANCCYFYLHDSINCEFLHYPITTITFTFNCSHKNSDIAQNRRRCLRWNIICPTISYSLCVVKTSIYRSDVSDTLPSEVLVLIFYVHNFTCPLI